jgi:hypothetical protein
VSGNAGGLSPSPLSDGERAGVGGAIELRTVAQDSTQVFSLSSFGGEGWGEEAFLRSARSP